MHHHRPSHLLVYCRLSILFVCAFLTFVPPLKAMPESLPSLETLKQGGLLIYMRHGATRSDQSDKGALNLDNCATQRNLSQDGVQQVKAIGQTIQAKGIPIGEVLSSPFCRCTETAKHAFGDYKVADFLHYSIGLSVQEREQITTRLRQALSTPVAAGTNRVLVSHTGNLHEATNIWPKPEGVAWVFRPTGDGYEVVGKINPDQWDDLN